MGSEQRVGRVRLVSGVLPRAMRAFYAAAFFSTALMAFVNFVQPLLLREFLQVPPEAQGTVSGRVGVVSELVLMAAVLVAGTLADRIGRRPIYAFGFLVLAVGYVFMPYVASTGELVFMRALFAIGAACVSAMLATVVADYPVEHDRGKATGAMGIMNGLGILFALFALNKIPGILAARGVPIRTATFATYGTAAFFCVVAALVVRFGLMPGGRPGGASDEKKPVRTIVREGLSAGRRPGVALAYATAFVSRGDLAVVGTFLPLWVQHHAASVGIDAARATTMGANITAISQGAAFLWAPIIGILCDRMPRVRAMSLALALATLGYGALYFVGDPLGGGMKMVVALTGIGQISALLASQVLVAQEAPAEARGPVMGVYGFFGAVGIALAFEVGGHLFDAWTSAGPFVFMAAMNGIVLVWSLVAGRSGARAVVSAAPSGAAA
jgi:MFS family permease